MFDIGYSELLLIAIVALVVIGPKDLPRVMRTVGQWVGKGRAMTRHVRAGFDTMMREAELEDMQKQWAQQNADIMRATPTAEDWMAPTAAADPVAQSVSALSASALSASASPAPVAVVEAEAAPVKKPRAKRPPKVAAPHIAGEA